MAMIRTISQLERECRQHGLEVTPSKVLKSGERRFVKQDYIDALARFTLCEKYGAMHRVPNSLRFRLGMKAPMLAYQFTRLKMEEKQEIWESKDWWLTEKMNGVRGILVYTPTEGLKVFSRNISVDDFLPVEYSDRMLVTIPPEAMDHAWAVDVEIKSTNPNIAGALREQGIETATELQAVTVVLGINVEDSLEIQKSQMVEGVPVLSFHLIDVLFWRNESLRKKPYFEREKFFDEAVSEIQSHGFPIHRIPYCKDPAHKKDFHEGILANGGEGTVAAYIHAPYRTDENRDRRGWVKIKRSVQKSLVSAGIGDTLDGYIVGFQKASDDKAWANMVGTVDIAVNLRDAEGREREHVLARVSNIPLSLRQKMTVFNAETGEVSLNPSYLQKVVEVDGQAISPRSLHLTHARIVRIRDDKSMFDCVMEESFLNDMIL